MNETATPPSAVPQLAQRLDDVAAALGDVLIADRRPLERRLHRLRRQHAAGRGKLRGRVERLYADCQRSAAVRHQRAAQRVPLACPPALPIAAHAQRITTLLETHQVVIVSAETGSGKSTQLPKLCLAAGRGVGGRVGQTQPRRVAAREIARRIAVETASAPGEVVGHCVRFDDNLAAATRIKVMTDGILLNEIHTDPWLEQYDTLIIDEVHERSLNIDFLLGYLKRVLARRSDLKLIITSATFDAAALADFYGGAAVCAIEGRSHPVELRYRPFDEDEEGDVNAAIVRAVEELDRDGAADVLVFLPGEREIREAATVLARRGFADTEILRLYARLGAAQQARVFEPGPARRIVLATNVAETSLTVPRVRHVIDTGLARVSRYSPRRKLQQLPVEKVARANADQRLGRCGREAPGICIRLYAEDDYLARRAAVEPEILRTNLAGVILRLKAMGIADIEQFSFAERPAERLVKDGYTVLQEIGALDAERRLNDTGRALARFPVDPRLARVLLAAGELGCLREALVITAALSIADPRDRPHEVRELADRAHAAFADKRSDFMWFVRAWPFARELVAMPPKRRARQCRRRFLSAARMHEWVLLHDDLARRARAGGMVLNPEPGSYKAVHTALAAGFPSLLGEWQGDHYLGCRNLSFGLHPASTLHRRGAKWILAGEIVDTERPYARLAARVDPQWVVRAADHLVRRTYEAPYWDTRRGCARVTEIQRLFGLVINASRQVELARVDAPAARELFLGEGLVEGALGDEPDFLRHNLALVARVHELEARARRRDLLAPRVRLAEFYAGRLPPRMCTRRELLRWLRADPERDAMLRMSEADVTSDHLLSVPAYLFPDTLEIAGTACALSYRFEPGDARDGVTVRVPLVLLPRLQRSHFDRLVPGLLSEKVAALLRSLPKRWRRQFSPVRDFAMAAVEALDGHDGPLDSALAAILSRLAGSEVPAELLDEGALEPHLRCLIELVGEDGEVLAAARDLAQLEQARYGDARSAAAALQWEVGGRSSGPWTFGEIPARVAATAGDSDIVGYPGLEDRGDLVELVVYEREAQAARCHLDGVARLLVLGAGAELRSLERQAAGDVNGALQALAFGHEAAAIPLLVRACARRAVEGCESGVRDARTFRGLQETFRRALVAEVESARRRLGELLARGSQLRRRVDGDEAVPGAARADILGQLAVLLGPRAAVRVDADGALRYDRYLDAIERRLERIAGNPGKDLAKLDRLAPMWARFLEQCGEADPFEPRAAELHGLFEEYRIALFAPELGSAVKISATGLGEALAALAGDA